MWLNDVSGYSMVENIVGKRKTRYILQKDGLRNHEIDYFSVVQINDIRV